MKPYIALLLILLYFPSKACINEYDIDAHGKEHLVDAITITFSAFEEKEITDRLRKLEKSLTAYYNFKDHSDYGANLLKLGCTPEALKIFQDLIKSHPKEYTIAANLGTAYELAGQNDSALKYIKLGIKLNPYSHSGSEWVHVKILETKLKKITVDELKKTNVLGLEKVEKKNGEDLLREVLYQLYERMPFTPLGDPLLAKVLSETSDFMANNLSMIKGELLLKMAKLYYPPWTQEFDEKIEQYNYVYHKQGAGKRIEVNYDRVNLKKLSTHAPLKVNYNYKEFKAPKK